MQFGPLDKTRFTVLTPVVLMGIIGAYAACKVGWIYRTTHKSDEARVLALKRLHRRTVTVATTLFTTGSIMFVRNSTRFFNCVSANVAGEVGFMVVSGSSVSTIMHCSFND